MLQDNFQINNAPDAMNPLSLSGESLRIFPHRDYAESSGKVTVASKHSRLTGTGMSFWFSNQRLLLLDGVNGFYDN